VLDLIAGGLGNAVIAARLGLPPATVGNHITSIFVKLQVTTRARSDHPGTVRRPRQPMTSGMGVSVAVPARTVAAATRRGRRSAGAGNDFDQKYLVLTAECH
jgi:hypothetical protein